MNKIMILVTVLSLSLSILLMYNTSAIANPSKGDFTPYTGIGGQISIL